LGCAPAKVDHGFEGLRSRPAEAAEATDPEDAAVCETHAHKGFWVEPKLLAEIE